MSENGDDKTGSQPLTGTTYRVYRYLFKAGVPIGVYDIQRALNLSSPSVAQYHVKKLLQMGLIKEESQGYVLDKIVFDNIIRIRRIAIPTQVGYVAFFAVILGALLTLRPSVLSSVYFIAIISSATALLIFVQQAIRTLRRIG